ncbi:hypothetical protein AB0I10_24940 [Streptomyces sp. NPDC050636]
MRNFANELGKVPMAVQVLGGDGARIGPAADRAQRALGVVGQPVRT